MMRQTAIGFYFLIGVFMLLIGCNAQPTMHDDSAVRDRARAHTDLGAAYFKQNKLSIALDEFTLASRIDPSFGFAYNGLGLVHAALGQDEDAQRAFKRAINIDPKNSEAHNNYGNFLCSRGQYEASIKEFLVAVENPLYTTPAAAYTNAGICAERAKDKKNAQVYYKNALQIDPLSEVAAYQLANIQYEQNNASDAYNTIAPSLVGQPSAKMLALAIRVTHHLGLKADEAKYRLLLTQRFPDSEQAKRLNLN